MGIQKPGLLEQLIINGGLSFVPIQLRADRGFDITYGRQVGRSHSQVHGQGWTLRSPRPARQKQEEAALGRDVPQTEAVSICRSEHKSQFYMIDDFSFKYNSIDPEEFRVNWEEKTG